MRVVPPRGPAWGHVHCKAQGGDPASACSCHCVFVSLRVCGAVTVVCVRRKQYVPVFLSVNLVRGPRGHGSLVGTAWTRGEPGEEGI